MDKTLQLYENYCQHTQSSVKERCSSIIFCERKGKIEGRKISMKEESSLTRKRSFNKLRNYEKNESNILISLA